MRCHMPDTIHCQVTGANTENPTDKTTKANGNKQKTGTPY